MGGNQQSKLTDVSLVDHLSYLEEGDFAKLYKGYLSGSAGSGSSGSSGSNKQPVCQCREY